jgi:hypothetical protein
MRPRAHLVTGVLLGAALAAAHGSSAGCSRGACPSCGKPAANGTLGNLELIELSGVAVSGVFDDVFYAHNDSGDSSRLFAFDRTGADLGTLEVAGAANDDWEDIASGPCDAGRCLYIGDIGDNDVNRPLYTVYRVPEPTAIVPGVQTLSSERIDFVYEDGPHDAEVLLVHPETGAVTLVTKVDEGPSSIYELPLPLVAGTMVTAVKVGEVEPIDGSSKFTGGAVHPEGTGVLLRTRSDLFYYEMVAEQTVARALAGDPCPSLVAAEARGEAVTWLPGGAGILTVGEGQAAPVNIASCDP